MAQVVYVLCALVAAACMLLLFRKYSATKARLLLWSGLCFAGLTAANVILFVDVVLVPEIDLSLWRNVTTLAGAVFLVFGLVWDAR